MYLCSSRYECHTAVCQPMYVIYILVYIYIYIYVYIYIAVNKFIYV